MQYVTRRVDSLGAGISGAVGALFLGQFPQFYAQYIQRWGGHLDEARYISDNYVTEDLSSRIEYLQHGYESLRNAGPIQKLPAFLGNFDFDVYKGTLNDYTPGMTFTTEEILYAGLGIILGVAVYELAKLGINAVRSRRNGRGGARFGRPNLPRL